MHKNGCLGVNAPCGCSGKRQRALTPPEELDGCLATAITIFHITRIVSQVLLFQRVNSEGNGHFLFTKMFFDHSAKTNKQTTTKTTLQCLAVVNVINAVEFDVRTNTCEWASSQVPGCNNHRFSDYKYLQAASFCTTSVS